MWSTQSLVFLVRFSCNSFTFIVPSYFTMFCTEVQSDLASLLSNKRKVFAGRIRKKYKTIFVLTGLVKIAENSHEHFKSGSFWWGFISISLFIAPMKWTHLFNGSAWMTQTADRWYKVQHRRRRRWRQQQQHHHGVGVVSHSHFPRPCVDKGKCQHHLSNCTINMQMSRRALMAAARALLWWKYAFCFGRTG